MPRHELDHGTLLNARTRARAWTSGVIVLLALGFADLALSVVFVHIARAAA